MSAQERYEKFETEFFKGLQDQFFICALRYKWSCVAEWQRGKA